MSRFLKELLCTENNFGSINKTNNETEMNKKRLKEKLNRKQKKLFLRYEDSKDLIIDNVGDESFVEGFKFGLKIGYEINKD